MYFTQLFCRHVAVIMLGGRWSLAGKWRHSQDSEEQRRKNGFHDRSLGQIPWFRHAKRPASRSPCAIRPRYKLDPPSRDVHEELDSKFLLIY